MKQEFKFQTTSDFDPEAWKGEKVDPRSLTVPDLSYKIKDLLENHTKLPPIAKVAFYDEDVDLEQFATRDRFQDLTQITENQLKIDALQQSLKDQNPAAPVV